MAVEWIQLDVWFSKKPEIHQVAEETGRDPDYVTVRIQDFWSWVSTTTSNGIIKGSPATLSRVIGGDDEFWLAVERAGWVKFQSGTIEVPLWEKRFSKSAKARVLDNQARNGRSRSGQKSDKNRTASGFEPDGDRTVSGFNPDKNRTLSDSEPDKNRLDKKRLEEIRKEKEEIHLAPSPNSSDSEPVPAPLPSQASKPKSETKPDPAQIGEVVLTFPVVGDAECPEFHIRQGLVDEFQVDFPGVDVVEQFRAAFRWVKASPERRKTARGMRKFLHGWIERNLNRSKGSPAFPVRESAVEVQRRLLGGVS